MALFEGTAGADVLVGGDGDDVLRGLGGDDFLDGGLGSDVFEFGRGDGQDTLNHSPSPDGERDRLQLGAGITLSDLVFTVDEGNLVLGIKGSTDSVRLLNYVYAGENGGTDIVLADGTVLDPQAVTRVLQAQGDLSLGGSPGADALIGGAGNDTLVGMEGDDALYGGTGNDILDGGAGSDTYHFARGDGRDTVIDGPSQPGERNRLQLGTGITLSDVTFTLENGDLVVSLKGSTDSVRITNYFGPGPNERIDIAFADGTVLGGLAVDQAVNAYPGGSSLHGTPGADALISGAGNDTLMGQEGNDVLYGGAGNDLLDGGFGRDTYHFNRGDGQDTVIDGPTQPGERNRLQLGAGILLSDVTLTLNNGDLLISLKGSTDSIRLTNYSGPGLEERTEIVFADGAVLDGLVIDRALNANPGGTDFNGTPGADALLSGAGDDSLYGAAGNDVLYGGAGNDQLDGGEGRDTYHFNRGDGQDTVRSGWSRSGERDRLQLGAGILLSDLTVTRDDGSLVLGIKGTADSVRLESYWNLSSMDRPDIVLADGAVLDAQVVDRALGAYGDDSLSGRPDGDVLLGGAGNDTLDGSQGNDALYGGTGNDLLRGNGGHDTYHFGRGDGRDTVIDGPVQPGEHNRLQLGTGITLSDVSFTLENGDLVVSLKGSTDSVRITNYFGPGPNERIDIAFADGTVLDGLAVDQAVNAYPGGSSLYGTQVADALIGGAGNDTLMGQEGNDVLYGGAGNDLLDGGLGRDTYHFNRGDGRDTVIDGPSQPGERNRLQLGAGILLSDVTLTLNNGDLLISLKGSTDSIRLTNYSGPGLEERTEIVFADGAVLDGLVIDRALNANPGGTDFNGTLGADALLGGAGDDSLYGAEGNDVLYGGAGNDQLDGGEGRDTYHFNRGDGQDTVRSGWSRSGERDRLQLGAGILLSDLTFTQDGSNLVLGIKGTADSVRLESYWNMSSTDRPDIVLADGAVLDAQVVDRALGAYGDDSLGGRSDGDVLLGGAGNDTLDGWQGNDALYGGTGNDLLRGNGGHDTYHFGRGDGRDTVIDGPVQPGEHNRLQLGTGITLSDVSFTLENGDLLVSLKGSTDSVRITNYFGPGPNERIDIAFADGTVLGGLAVDQAVNAYPGGSSLHGTPGADALIGGAGNDTLLGQEGNDVLYGGAGNDLLDGGLGRDTYHFNRGDGQDTVIDGPSQPGERNRLQLGAGILLSDVSIKLENGDLVLSLKGSTDSIRLTNYSGPGLEERTEIVFADGAVLDGLVIDRALNANPGGTSLNGTPSADALVGGAGDDSLYGAEGNDVLYGGAGNDQLDGGEGRDTYHFNRGDGQDTVRSGWSRSGERDRLQLGAGILLSDLTFTQDGSNLVLGIKGTADSVRLESYWNMSSTDRPDIVLADGAVLDAQVVDRALNAYGDDSLGGTQGADALLGGAGNDTLVGMEGDDALYGGTGNDLLDGGAGSDTYHFSRGDGQDTAIAKSSQPGEKDRLQLGHGIAQGDVSVRADNADLVLTLSGGTDSIRLIDYLLQPQNDRTVVAFADGSVWDTVQMERQALNQAPVVGVPLADAAVTEGAPFRYVVPAGAFSDADGDDALTLSIGLAGGAPLPQWLQFDAASGVLGGVPPAGSATALNLVVTATDRFGASAQDGFDLVVAPAVVTINGTAQADRLTGTAANDEIRGFAGNDMLLGGAGNDLLDGGAGIDSMSGGAGNDTYVVDSTSDRVIENAGEGIDRVNASVSHTLGNMVEALTLTGTGAIQGTGNALDNTLVGNAAGNTLSGAGGNDTLDGGAGRDTLVGGTGNDVYRLARGHGIDTVVESDATVGNTDTLQLGADIASAQLWFARSGSNLEVSVIGTADKAVINGWYAGNRYHVEQFRSGDGKLLLDSQVDGLVNAMAAFAPPAAGQTTLPANHQAGLDAVIASSWK